MLKQRSRWSLAAALAAFAMLCGPAANASAEPLPGNGVIIAGDTCWMHLTYGNADGAAFLKFRPHPTIMGSSNHCTSRSWVKLVAVDLRTRELTGRKCYWGAGTERCPKRDGWKRIRIRGRQLFGAEARLCGRSGCADVRRLTVFY